MIQSEVRTSPLELSPEQFREAGHQLVDQIAEFLDSIRDRAVTPALSVAQVRDALQADRTLPEHGQDPVALATNAFQLLADHSLLNGHPRFWGYITSAAVPIGALGDLMAAAVNPNVGAWNLSPIATEIEAQTVRWIAEMLGYPTNCGGLFVSGGNMANIVCFLAARAAKADWDVRAEGAKPRLVSYCSSETHTWIKKAVDMAGLGTDSVRWIPADDRQRMGVQALRAQIRRDEDEGLKPFLVVGTAGSVMTGAVDPLFDLAALCKEMDLWFHVDGAYGAFAAVLPDCPKDFAALELADSIAADPHKWLYAPVEAGVALVKDEQALRGAFSYGAAYYTFGADGIDYYDLGPQNSRGFRALKVWLALQQAGRAGYEQSIGEDCRLSREMFAALGQAPGIEAVNQGLSIATFRFVPESGLSEEYLNELNRQLLTRIQHSGEAYLSNAVVGGRFLLRACIVNFRTSSADIKVLVETVSRLGRQVHGEMQAKA
jgi:glutamate/tyrosine decarboxylase-like PLP-dependent enzyme